jgi:hypothetical protein
MEIKLAFSENPLKLNEGALEKELSKKQLIEMVSNDAVQSEYGLKYFHDDIWLRATSDEGDHIEITAHQILTSLLCSPDQFEEFSADIISHFVFISSSVAGGQGGGIAIIDVKTGRWIYSTDEGVYNKVLFIPQFEVFIFLSEVSTYAWNYAGIKIVPLEGDIRDITIYKTDNHVGSAVSPTTHRCSPLETYDDEKVELETDFDGDFYFDQKEGFLYLLGRWRANFSELLKLEEDAPMVEVLPDPEPPVVQKQEVIPPTTWKMPAVRREPRGAPNAQFFTHYSNGAAMAGHCHYYDKYNLIFGIVAHELHGAIGACLGADIFPWQLNLSGFLMIEEMFDGAENVKTFRELAKIIDLFSSELSLQEEDALRRFCEGLSIDNLVVWQSIDEAVSAMMAEPQDFAPYCTGLSEEKIEECENLSCVDVRKIIMSGEWVD